MFKFRSLKVANLFSYFFLIFILFHCGQLSTGQQHKNNISIPVNIENESLFPSTTEISKISKLFQSSPVGEFHVDDEFTKLDSDRSLIRKIYLSDFMPDHIRNNGGVLVHIILLMYICLALGVVCDYYFLSSLAVISQALNLPPDVTGATFMAIGTSAPELFTSIIGVFISDDDIGIGTILGSAVFNMIFITAICAFVARYSSRSQSLAVSKFTILRDSIFYLIATITLLLVVRDNLVDWVESVSMLVLFGIYLIIMYFNTKLVEYVHSSASSVEPTEATPLLTPANSSSGGAGSDTDRESIPPSPSHFRSSSFASQKEISHSRRYSSISENGLLNDENWIENNKFFKFMLFPMLLMFTITIPRTKSCNSIFTFLISIVWIIFLTYLSVWLVYIIGSTFQVPETVGGLTFLAAGTSIPELISSVLVVKRAGLADMALSNSIGSNIFDILVGLGLPWLIKSIILMLQYKTLNPIATLVSIHSEALSFTTFILLLTIVALIGTLSLFKWKLTMGVGISLFLVYLIFLAVSSAIEILFH